MTRGLALTVTLSALALCVPAALPRPSAAAPSCPLPAFGPGQDYHPVIEPASFSTVIDNRRFPMRPGTVLVYAGTKDGKQAVDVVAPSRRTRLVGGVRTRVVEDRLYLDGRLAERTADYYAQDRCGNVWYFGEDTAELDRRGDVTSREGTFHAGVDGAQPGVIMTARPVVGEMFRQEWYPGHAEDAFTTLSRSARVRVPAGSFAPALLTEETTALEPGVVGRKYYAAGIGMVKELDVKGGDERMSLVEVIRLAG